MAKEEDLLIDLLRQVKEVLDDHNVEFWLECGTLLGAVRDRKIMSWEHDLDFGAWSEKVPYAARLSIGKQLTDKGLRVMIAENYMDINNSKKTYADINFYTTINDKAVVPLSKPETLLEKVLQVSYRAFDAPHLYYIDIGNSRSILFQSILVMISRMLPSLLRKRIARVLLTACDRMDFKDVSWRVPSKYFSEFAAIQFYGMEFKVPAKKEDYLTYRYGEDWRIPRRDWVTEEEDGAVASR